MLVKTLQRLAKSGYTILCTIDQPTSDVYALFNKYVRLNPKTQNLFSITINICSLMMKLGVLSFFQQSHHFSMESYEHQFILRTLMTLFLDKLTFLRIILLAEGRITYLGPSSEAVSYFGR